MEDDNYEGLDISTEEIQIFFRFFIHHCRNLKIVLAQIREYLRAPICQKEKDLISYLIIIAIKNLIL